MEGRLAGRVPADILSEVQRRQASGILRFHNGQIARQLFIDAGVMIRFAASTLPSESMTNLFRDRGGITQAQLREASDAKQSHELLGTALVRLGTMTRQALADLTQEHIRCVAHGALLLDDGTFQFQQGALPYREQLDTGLRSAVLLLEWARDVPDIDWIRRRLGPLEARIQLSSRPPEGYQNVPLNPAEGYTMSRVDGAASLREICIVSPMGEETTLRALFGLILAGILEAPNGTQVPESIGSPRSRARPVAQGPGAAGRAPGSGGLRRPIPPRRVTNPRERVGPARSRRGAPGVAERARAAAPPDLEQQMLERFERIYHQSLYEVLEVARSAGTDDVRRAYYGLAKKFHPDKFTSEAAKVKAEKVFAHITEAYSTLSHPETRRKYEEELAYRTRPKQTAKGADTESLARTNFRHGRDHLSKGRFAEALPFLQNACELDPSKAEYWYHLGLTQSRNPRWKKEAESSLLRAIKIDPTNADAYALLGGVYAKGRLASRARDMFQKALQWDPGHAGAQQGLAALEGEGKKGLLGIFKR
ncbi:MAG: DnaJ domain-containing protein [Acidobacteriota bacterium]